jgi:hypothetical protein
MLPGLIAATGHSRTTITMCHICDICHRAMPGAPAINRGLGRVGTGDGPVTCTFGLAELARIAGVQVQALLPARERILDAKYLLHSMPASA